MVPAPRFSILWLAAIAVGGCTGAPVTAPLPTSPTDPVARGTPTPWSGAVDQGAPVPAVAELPTSEEIFDQDLGIGVLMPRVRPVDSEVVKVAGFSVRKSHLYDRLFEINPLWTKKEIDWIVFDILLAKEAIKHNVFIDVDMIDKRVTDAEGLLEERVKSDWGGRMTLDAFLIENRGITRKFYRAMSRRQLARGMLRYYVVRYLAGLQDRVSVRIISHRNRATMQSILKKVGEGADFRSLALRESEHPTQRRGGLLPPFGRDSSLKFKIPAFELQPGEVSKILTVESDAVTHYYLLYCVARIPGRKLPFKDVKAELDKDQVLNPLSEEEKLDLYARLRSASESLPKDEKKR